MDEPQFAAQPRTRERDRGNRDWVPMGPEAQVPCGYRTGDAHGQAYSARYEGMLHRPIGCKAGGDVAARDTVDDAIGCRQCEQRTGHRLAPRRKNVGEVQDLVGAERKAGTHEKTSKKGADASAKMFLWIRLAHDRECFSGGGATGVSTSRANLS